jgi:putative membrane protein
VKNYCIQQRNCEGVWASILFVMALSKTLNRKKMKNEKTIILAIAVYAAAMIMIFNIIGAHAQERDPVKSANAANEKKSDEEIVEEDIADFLVKSADARMMDTQEGKLATQKGTSSQIREYGKLMVKDQSLLLDKIKMLAEKRNITLPTGISDKKEDGREDLAEESGKDFDEKFIKMMKLDHERDVKLFRKATEYEDLEIRAFATEYLPMIQSHLDRINEIKIAENKM